MWSFDPPFVYLGENVTIIDLVNSNTTLTILFLKAVIYFSICVQLDIVT
jgi:hypothetical protein